MKIKAINLVDLYNYSMQTIAWSYEEFERKSVGGKIIGGSNITPEILRNEVNGHLDKLNRLGFNKNTTYVIIDPSNPVMHIAVDHHKYEDCQGLSWSLITNPDAREYFHKVFNLVIPTSIRLAEELEYVKRSSHSYIKFITFAADFNNSVLAMRDACPIDIDVIEMREIFSSFHSASKQSMIIDCYEFYNMIYGEPIMIEMDIRNQNLLNTRAGQAISMIMN